MDQLQKAEEALKAAHDKRESAYDVEIKKLDDVKRGLLDRLHDLNEKKKQCAAVYGDINVSDDDLIEVNVGGKIISAKRGVLCQMQGTRLEALFSGAWDKKLLRDSCGRIFLDVNGDCFQAIVDFLNELAISAEDEQPDPPWKDGGEMTQIFTYFGLHFFPSNIIKQSSHLNTIHQWLHEDGSDGDLKLIYSSSRDGLSNEMFYDKCGNVGPTLTVFELDEGEGCVIGGYTNTPWQSTSALMTANKAFLFALEGFGITSPIKMTLKDANGIAVQSYPGHGPIFRNEDRIDMYMTDSYVTLKSGGAYEDTPWQSERKDIKEMEVYQVIGEQRSFNPANKQPKVDQFTKEINEAINEKWKALRALKRDLTSLEERFKDEQQFIESLSSEDVKDIITLNVSGTVMATKRATLMVVEDSMLAQQFDDTKWTEQGNGNSPKVKEWTPDDENDINGFELIALDKDGLKMLGVERVGTICLLSDEIKSLKEKVNQDAVTLIEHSPYCFGKILDYLRLKRLQSINLAEEPAPPTVCESQQKRFEKVVQYYFPGETSTILLGSADSIMAEARFDDPESLKDAIIESFQRRPNQHYGLFFEEIFADCHSQGYYATELEVKRAMQHLRDQGLIVSIDEGFRLRWRIN
eukprot:scaffold1837_cov124-Skeletonema_menzelii.AAC.4